MVGSICPVATDLVVEQPPFLEPCRVGIAPVVAFRLYLAAIGRAVEQPPCPEPLATAPLYLVATVRVAASPPCLVAIAQEAG